MKYQIQFSGKNKKIYKSDKFQTRGNTVVKERYYKNIGSFKFAFTYEILFSIIECKRV